ncbi:MAG: response regulator transcription factor [Bacteroidales bacterium]|nr:response regulator transcription factor [Bacteroidales bacterium]
MIRVFIIDDHQLFIDGLTMLLGQVAELEVVGHAASGEEGIIGIENQEVDVLITDYSMSGMSGYEVVKYVRNKFPHIKIITLTMHAEIYFIDKMINAGSLGYLMKNTGKKELVESIKAVMRGESYYSPLAKEAILNRYTNDLSPKKQVKRQPSGMPVRFTRREIQLLKMIQAGLLSKEIADALSMSLHTVNAHRRNINSKIAASSDLTVLEYIKKFNVLD